MTFLQLFLLCGLTIIFALAAAYPRRLVRPRRSADPFLGLENDWRQIMGDSAAPTMEQRKAA